MEAKDRERYENLVAYLRNELKKTGFGLIPRMREEIRELDCLTEEVAAWGTRPRVAIWFGRWWGTDLYFWFGFQGGARKVKELFECVSGNYEVSFWNAKEFVIGNPDTEICYEVNTNHTYHYIGRYDTSFDWGTDVELVDLAVNFINEIVNGVEPLAEIDISEVKSMQIPETERQALISARRGQGKFRRALENMWDARCAVTGCNIKEALRASHIQSWKESNNEERLDENNGLLLTATLDALFDKYLISFEDNGRMLIAPHISPDDRARLALDGMRLSETLSAQQRKYLASHRNRFNSQFKTQSPAAGTASPAARRGSS